MESIDFTGLAARAVAGLHEVRACLLASRDGLTLAALPEGREELARRALDRLETVGQPERGFLVIGDEVWVVSRRGPYVGIVVAAATAKAGLLLDRLESTLRAAEEARHLAGSAGPGRPEVPRRPRTPLHREPRVEPSRPEIRPPNPLFEEVARVVSVPEKEAERAEPSVGEASAPTAWPHVIRKPEAPIVGGPGSPSAPPIVRPTPEPEREEPRVVTPQPEPKEPEINVPEPKEHELTTPEPEVEELEVEGPEALTPGPEPEQLEVEGPEQEEPEAVTPEPEPEQLEAVTPEPEQLEAVTPEPEPEQPKAATPEPEVEEPEITAPEREEPELATPEPEEEPKVEALEQESAQEEILVPEPEIIPPQVDLERELPHSQPAALHIDSALPEPEVPDVERELEALELFAPMPETRQEPPKEPAKAEDISPEAAPEVEPAKAEDISPAAAPEVEPAPPHKLARPDVEPPKAIPHYSPPDALLGEMGKVVAGETSPGETSPGHILRLGVSELPGAQTDATGKDVAEPPRAKTPESEKERGEDTEVDPVALAREFSQLFDEPERNS